MKMTATGRRVRDVLTTSLRVTRGRLLDSARFVEDFEVDSLDMTNAVLALEKAFNCEIPDDAVDTMKTVGDVILYLERHAPVDE